MLYTSYSCYRLVETDEKQILNGCKFSCKIIHAFIFYPEIMHKPQRECRFLHKICILIGDYRLFLDLYIKRKKMYK